MEEEDWVKSLIDQKTIKALIHDICNKKFKYLSDSKERNKVIEQCINFTQNKINNIKWFAQIKEEKITFMEKAKEDCHNNIHCIQEKSNQFDKSILESIIEDYSLPHKKYTHYKIDKDHFKKLPEKIEKLKQLATFLLTDGSLLRGKEINFYNKNEVLVNKFMNIIREFIPNAIFYTRFIGKDKKTHHVSIVSK